MNKRPDMAGKGDKMIVWKLGRLARNMNGLTKIIEALDHKGASLEILDQKTNTSIAIGKAFLPMLGLC